MNASVFITSRLDYCNSLYLGLQHSSPHHLQLVQNAAARLLTGVRMYEHIPLVLANLHWLPAKYRIDFKIILLTFKVLNNMAPSYLSGLLNMYNPKRELRSSRQMLIVQLRSRLKRSGLRSCSA